MVPKVESTKRSVDVKAERSLVLILGAVALFLLAVPAFAGVVEPECTATIEVNALRGGSPTVSADANKNITAKARITKGTGPADQAINDTTLTIDALDPSGPVLDSAAFPTTFTLVVGKGGQGGKVGLTVDTCDSSINYVATFTGTQSDNGAMCTKVSRELNKTCK